MHMVASNARTGLTSPPSPRPAHGAPEGRRVPGLFGPQRDNPLPLLDRGRSERRGPPIDPGIGIAPAIPPLHTRTDPWKCGKGMYGTRDGIERPFRRVAGFRGIFCRFEKFGVLFLRFFFALIRCVKHREIGSRPRVADVMRKCPAGSRPRTSGASGGIRPVGAERHQHRTLSFGSHPPIVASPSSARAPPRISR